MAILKRIPLILALAAGIFLTTHILYAPVPGPSAAAISGYAGLQPFRPLTAPIWGALIQALARLPGLSLAAAAAALHVLIGLITVYWMARILTDLPYRELQQDSVRGIKDDALPRAVAAVAAAFFLVATTAFQAAFLIPHAEALGLPLLLMAWHAFQQYHTQNRLPALYRCAALLAVGAVESATVAIAAPLFAVYAFFILGVRRQFAPRVVAISVACGLLGVIALIAAVSLYYSSPVAEWREVARWRDAFDLFRREYMAAGPRAVPRQGWLVIFLFALLPIPFVFSRRFQQREEEATEFGMTLLRFVMLPAIAMIVLFDLPTAPMRVAQSESALLTPYAAVALWFGRLAGIVFAWLQYPPRARGPKTFQEVWQRPLALALLVLLAVTSSAAWWKNRPVAQRENALALARLVDETLAAASDGGWVVTDGGLDPAIQVRARDRGARVRALNWGALGSVAYQRFLHGAQGFPDPDWIAAVGIEPVLTDWFEGEIGAGRSPVGAVAREPPLPDGIEWLPVGVVVKAQPAAPVSVDLLESALEALRRYLKLPPLKPSLSLGLARQRDWLARVGARWSNEIGVDLFGAGAYDAARSAFEQALLFYPDHLAALINLRETRIVLGETPDDASLAKIQRQWRTLPAGAALRMLRAQFGRIVSPNAARAESAEWIAYGFTDRALKQARGGAVPADDAAARLVRAFLLAEQGEIANAAGEVEHVLQENADAIPHRLVLMRMRVAEGRFEEARELLEDLRKRGLPESEVEIETARILLAERRVDEALSIARTRLKREPLHPEAALMQALALGAAGREAEWRDALAVLEQASGRYPRGLLYLAEMSLLNRDRAAAVRYLERAHAVQPGARVPLETLLELELSGAAPEAIERRARALLAIDPQHPLAWYGVGVSMARRNRWELAVEAFEKSNARQPSHRMLNDWAWALHQLGRSDLALEKSGAACALQPGIAFLWSTRGKIAYDAGRYAEAAESFERALAIGRPDVRVQAALWQTYLALNDVEAAARVRAELDARSAFMTESEVRALLDPRPRGSPP